MNQQHQEMNAKIAKLLQKLDESIFDYRDVKIAVIQALLTKGHVLLEGVPGLAKSLLVSTLQSAISNSKKVRVQMTPDLMPSDIIGVMAYNPKIQEFEYKAGPIIGVNIALMDEINRATSKTQSALLEAMQERQVTVDGKTYKMEDLFMVLATQNPIEQEGTYPLPEAQQDRFCFKLNVDYASRSAELNILNIHVHGPSAQSKIEPVISVEDILAIGDYIDQNVRVEPPAREYIVDLVRCTRPQDQSFEKVASQLKDKIKVGASPRAQIWLYRTAQARAFMAGRDYVKPEDVKAIAPNVLRHRIILTDMALLDGYTTDDAIKVVLDAVPIVEPRTR